MRTATILLVFYASSIHADLVFMHEVKAQKRIWLTNTAGSRPLTASERFCLYPDIDAAGERVAYVCGNEKSTSVFVRNLKSDQEELVSPVNGLQLHPDFSGDGRLLGYSSPVGEGGTAQIVLWDTSKRVHRTIVDRYASYFPALSSDGSFLIYQRTRGPKSKEIVLYAGGKTTTLPVPYPVAMAPALSFDDRFVAFTAFHDGVWDIFTFDLSTKRVRRVTKGVGRSLSPSFEPDGSIVFASDRSGRFGLYRVTASQWMVEPQSAMEVLLLDGDIYSPSISGPTGLITSVLPDIPAPSRSSFGAIRVGDRVYVVGGHQGSEHTYPEHSFLNRVDILGLKTGTWSSGASRWIASHGFGLASKGKYIYAFGGFAFAAPEQEFIPRWRSLDLIERYDTESDRWEIIGRMPRKRSSYVVATVGTKAFLIGGWDSTPRFNKDYDGVFHRAIDVFDFETETISESSFELPNPLRRAFSGVVQNGEIYLVGGLGQGATHFELLSNVSVLNPLKGEWRELPRLPFATFAPAVGLLNDRLMVFGGMFKIGEKDYSYVNHLFEYGGEWSHAGRFMRESKGFAQVVDDTNGLIVLGGHAYFGDADSPVASVDRWEVRSLPSF